MGIASSLLQLSDRGRTKAQRDHGVTDTRPELGQALEPYARFDKDIEKFCCRKCGYQAVTYRGIDAHLATSGCVS